MLHVIKPLTILKPTVLLTQKGLSKARRDFLLPNVNFFTFFTQILRYLEKKLETTLEKDLLWKGQAIMPNKLFNVTPKIKRLDKANTHAPNSCYPFAEKLKKKNTHREYALELEW